ncbi:TonB family protein [Kordiimonas sp.]|uniref:TonB family protein n=1 Tax=Kordiimonas sp. TaxID=1970157 RepID=UPI003A9145BA
MKNNVLAAFWSMTLVMLAANSPARAFEEGNPQDGMWLMSKCTNPGLAYQIKRHRTEGYVSVLFDISADGNVENIRITESVPEGAMDDYVTRALNRWQYFGYVKDAELARRENVELTFTFGEEDSRRCTHTKLPELPSTMGNPQDPHQSLKACLELEMPRTAARRKQQGLVELHYDITAEGEVVNMVTATKDADPIFTDSAEKALRRWTYQPFLKAGKPIERKDMVVQFHYGDLPDGAADHRCSFAPWHATQKTMPAN